MIIYSPVDNLLKYQYKKPKKEALEEAGIKILKKNLTIGNTISYCHDHKNQIHSGTIFIYDYNIDKDVKLKNL